MPSLCLHHPRPGSCQTLALAGGSAGARPRSVVAVVRGVSGSPVLVLCSDEPLRDSLADLLIVEGRAVLTSPPTARSTHPGVVVAACDAWPPGWNLARLRATFRRVPCLMLSGSPLAGDFVVSQLPRGYFVHLPALPGKILRLVAELSGA